MVDYASFAHGAVVYPLTTSTGNSLLQDADPAIFHALDYLAWSLEYFMGTRITEVVASLTPAPPFDSAVGSSIPYDPTDYLTTEQFTFPMLAVWRSEDKLKDQSEVWRTNACAVGIAYVLPPLSAGQAEALLPTLHAAKSIIDHAVRQGWHPEYTPQGGAEGDRVWGSDHANLQTIDVTEAKYGHFPALDGSGLKFPAVVIDAVIHERDEAVAGAFETMAGANLNVDLEDDATDTTIADFVQTKSDVG